MKTELPLLDYTLWRDALLLGRVRIVFPVTARSRGLVAGMLEVQPAFVDIDELMQTQPPMPPRGRRLEVRDRSGRVLATDIISIDHLSPEFTERGELFEICAARGIPVSPWTLTAHVRDASPGGP